MTSLGRLADLERSHNGPVPELLRQIASLGSAEAVERVQVEASRDFYRDEIRKQLRVIKTWRDRGLFEGPLKHRLVNDLALYVRSFRKANARVWGLKRAKACRDEVRGMKGAQNGV